MGYIKISDPNIIDLGAWHQVINVVNQHSDTLNSLTNNFGKTNPTTVDYNAEAYSHLFDAGSQMIVYGRDKISTSSSHSGNVYYKVLQVTGGSTGVPAFSSTPVVIATINDGNTTAGGVFTSSNDDAIVSVYNVSSAGFSWRVYRASNVPITGSFYINWMAIGPRGH